MKSAFNLQRTLENNGNRVLIKEYGVYKKETKSKPVKDRFELIDL